VFNTLYDIILPEPFTSFLASCDLWLCHLMWSVMWQHDLCHLTLTLVLKIENRLKIKMKMKIKWKKEIKVKSTFSNLDMCLLWIFDKTCFFVMIFLIFIIWVFLYISILYFFFSFLQSFTVGKRWHSGRDPHPYILCLPQTYLRLWVQFLSSSLCWVTT